MARIAIDKEHPEKTLSKIIENNVWLDTKRETHFGFVERVSPPSMVRLRDRKTGKVQNYDLRNCVSYEIAFH